MTGPAVPGWTGGQLSLARAALGLGLAALWLQPWFGGDTRAPSFVAGACLGLALLFGVGSADRAAAPLLALAGAVWPLAGAPAAVVLAAVLLAHAALPPAPYLSVAARGRTDPGGDWRFPARVHAALWLVLGVGHAAGAAGLASSGWRSGERLGELARGLPPAWLAPLAVGAAAAALVAGALALVPGARRAAWVALVVLHLAAVLVLSRPELPLALLALDLYALDPAWIPPRRRTGEPPARLFYDGTCGLCHRTARFVLAEDRDGGAFRLAPLQGPTFAAAVDEERRRGLPDSLVVQLPDRTLRLRSDAAVEVLRRVGGLWRVAGELLALVPRPLRDLGYDAVARVRHRLFQRPTEACPLMPPDLGRHFDP